VKECTFAGSVAKLKLAQTWFLSSGAAAPDARKWNVPLFIRTLKDQNRKPVMMTEAEMEIEVPLSGDLGAEFVLINEDMRTPMRVLYTKEMHGRLAGAVKAGQLQASDRAGLVMDGYALAKTGKLGLDDLLRFLAGFCGETDYVVWEALAAVLNGLQVALVGGAPDDVYKRYMAFAERFVWKAWTVADLGWESKATDGHTGGMLRGLLMKLMAAFVTDASFLAEAQKRFDKYVEDPAANGEVLPDEFRVPVFKAVLAKGGQDAYSKIMGAFKKMESNQEMKQVYQSVGSTGEARLKMEALKWSISGEIKIQDFFYIIASVGQSSKSGLDMVWAFLQSDFETIYGMVKDASSILDAVIRVCTAGNCTTKVADEIEKFCENQKERLGQQKRTVAQILERIRDDAKFLDRVLATDVAKQSFWDELDGLVPAKTA